MVSTAAIDAKRNDLAQPAKRLTARTLGLGFLLALLLLAPTLLYPVGRDTANFLYCARVMARGGAIYRDAWELKPPGIFLAFSVLTHTCHGPALIPCTHIVDIALCGLVGTLLVLLAGEFGAPAAGWAAAAWYASFYLEGGFGNLGETEAWANPAVLGATLLCLRAANSRRDRDLLLAGTLAAAAALIKFTTLAPLLPFVLFALWRMRRLRAAFAFAGGFAVVIAIAVLWLNGIGAWAAYEDIQRNFVVPYVKYSAGPALPHLEYLTEFAAGFVSLLWLPSIFVFIATRSRNWNPALKAPTFAALALVMAAIWIQQKCILYYWQALLPLASLLAAIGCLEMLRLARVAVRKQAAVALLVALAWHAHRYLPEYGLATRYATGSISKGAWLAHFVLPEEGDPVGKAYSAAHYVAARTRPEDPVVVYGFESIIYLLSDRYAPTRFFFDPPVVSTYAPDAWRREFVEDLERQPPKLILLRHGDKSDWIGGPPGDSCELFHGSPPLETFLERHYHLDREDDGFAYYVRNERSATPIETTLKPKRISP